MKRRRKPLPPAVPEATNVPEPAPVPVTPDDLISASCPQCGALLPRMLSRLDAIPGQEHLRRAVTVALTGSHSITFIGTGSNLPDALAFGRISRAYGLTAYATIPCRCGNNGDPFLTCTCTPEIIAAWRDRREFRNALQSDIVVEASITSAEQRIAHRRGRRGVTDEAMLAVAAVAHARPRPKPAAADRSHPPAPALHRAGRAGARSCSEHRSARGRKGDRTGAFGGSAPVPSAYRGNARGDRTTTRPGRSRSMNHLRKRPNVGAFRSEITPRRGIGV
jgi:hypothetical protein